MATDPDLIRQSLQVYVNEATDNTGWLVTHYTAIAGLYRLNPDGTTTIRPVLVSPDGQARYITYGLLAEGPDLLTTPDDTDTPD